MKPLKLFSKVALATPLAFLAFLAACTQQEPLPTGAKEDKSPAGSVSALTSYPDLAGIGGCWSMQQGNYTGKLILKQNGTSVTGYMDWSNHADAKVVGTVSANGVKMTFTYLYEKEGVVGEYTGTVTSKYTLGGSTGGTAWTATSGGCLPEDVLPGCYSIEQGSYRGSLTINTNLIGTPEMEVAGFMDWEKHPDAVVLGTFLPSTRHLKVTFNYPKNQAGESQVGVYEADLSSDQMFLNNGITYSPKSPDIRSTFAGYSRTCKDPGGCFAMESVQNGVRRKGTARVTWSNYNLSGHIDWEGYGRVDLTGTHYTRQFDFKQSLSNSPVDGDYTSKLSHEADWFWYGEQYRSGVKVGIFGGSRILCPSP